MTCKIKFKKQNDRVVCKIIGALDIQDVNGLSRKLESLAKGKTPLVVVDLTETTYIDSSGLGVFVLAWKAMKAAGGELVFLKTQGFIHSIFESANLNQVIRMVDTPEDA
jgi:anti-sigma B factor antagonist